MVHLKDKFNAVRRNHFSNIYYLHFGVYNYYCIIAIYINWCLTMHAVYIAKQHDIRRFRATISLLHVSEKLKLYKK